MKNTQDIFNEFVDLYNKKEFKGIGEKQNIELQNVQFVADKDWIIRKPNYDYIKREINWYNSQSLNVNDIEGVVPKIWKKVATPLGYINSNYGWCIFSPDNGDQYNHCLNTLLNDYETRQAVMIYTRPSMHEEWNKNGMSDFMCTHYVHCFLNRKENAYELLYIVYQRSCDAVFGYNNDINWHKWVYRKLCSDLGDAGLTITERPIEYNCGSLHIYERHFKHLVENINIKNNDTKE